MGALPIHIFCTCTSLFPFLSPPNYPSLDLLLTHLYIHEMTHQAHQHLQVPGQLLVPPNTFHAQAAKQNNVGPLLFRFPTVLYRVHDSSTFQRALSFSNSIVSCAWFVNFSTISCLSSALSASGGSICHSKSGYHKRHWSCFTTMRDYVRSVVCRDVRESGLLREGRWEVQRFWSPLMKHQVFVTQKETATPKSVETIGFDMPFLEFYLLYIHPSCWSTTTIEHVFPSLFSSL